MISHLLSSTGSFTSFEKLEESPAIKKLEESSLNTMEEFPTIKKLERKNHLSSDETTELSDTEVRILNWLEENGVFHAVPEEKEFEYYEKKRKEAKDSILTIEFEIDNPLLLRRRNSLPNSSPSKCSPILKLSKFQISKGFEFHCTNTQ